MKTKIIIVALLLFSSICKSQITLDHSYPATYKYTGIGIINLSNSGYKYLISTYVNNIVTFKIYNMNHSLWKTITINIPTGYTYTGATNFSETLFNSDGLIEFYYLYYKTTPTIDYESMIVNENGTVVLSLPNCPSAQVVSAGTNGWKMLATMDSTNSFSCSSLDVYNLPGTMPTLLINNNDSNNIDALSNPYPNPSSSTVSINYQLPIGINSGEIVFYNLIGAEIKRFQVDNTFSTLELNNSDLPTGTYLYHLETTNDISSAKKMVVIK